MTGVAAVALAGFAPMAASSGLDGSTSACAGEIAQAGGLNACGCHFNHKTGECRCHQARGDVDARVSRRVSAVAEPPVTAAGDAAWPRGRRKRA